VPRQAPAVPKYSLHKPSGQAFVRIQGKFHYLGAYNSSESQERYAALIAEWALKPANAPPANADTQITVTELCAAYWLFAQKYYTKSGKPSGWLAHIRLMLRKTRKVYGLTSAAEFGPLKLKAVRKMLIDEGLSRPYINKLVPIITRMFKWAAAEEILPSGTYFTLRTVEGLRRGRTEAHETVSVKPVEDAVVDATLPYLSSIVADMVRFQRYTGCRPGEVCQLRPMDVERIASVWLYRPESHKTEHHNKARVIYIGPQGQNVIRPYLLRPGDAFCFSPVESENQRRAEMRAKRKTPIQPSQRNRQKLDPQWAPKEQYTKDSYRRAIKRAIDKGNKEINKQAEEMGVEAVFIPHWHPNQLRHTVATAIRKQYGLEAAQVILGHSKADVTQVYAERDMAKAIDVIQRIG
jgi:integrase